MTRKEGAIFGSVIGFGCILFLKYVQISTTSQAETIGIIIAIVTIALIGGTFVGFLSLFRTQNLLGSTTRDGFLLGFSSVFDITQVVISIATGQPIIPKEILHHLFFSNQIGNGLNKQKIVELS